ncbi:hypothetical protein FRC07_000846 [Ceratobasidium sp. 392]|nr:hypothetical protein FRC07_000846 [Ceratobasidium sp. 392]
MPHELPTELLALIADSVSHLTLLSLALASKTTYGVSVPLLYAVITSINIEQTVQCLDTLATNTRLARLVRVLYIEEEPYGETRSVYSPSLVKTALKNMTALTELTLHLNLPSSSEVLEHATFKLRDFVCFVESNSKFPIAHFLNTQPMLDSLVLFCDPEDLVSLSPSALPALRSVSAPHNSLQFLVPTCISRLIRTDHAHRVPSAMDQIAEIAWKCSKDASNRSSQSFLSIYLTIALQSFASLEALSITTSPEPQTGAYIDSDPVHDADRHKVYIVCLKTPTETQGEEIETV